MPDPSTSFWPPGRRAYIVVYMNKVDMVDDPSSWSWSNSRSASSCQYQSPATNADHQRQRSEGLQSESKDINAPSTRASLSSWTPWTVHSPAKRDIDKPYLMPIEDVFSIAARTVVTGRIERGIVKVGDEIEIVGIKPTQRPWSPASRCSGSFGFRPRPATTSVCCFGHQEGRSGARMVLAKPGSITPHTKFKPRRTY